MCLCISIFQRFQVAIWNGLCDLPAGRRASLLFEVPPGGRRVAKSKCECMNTKVLLHFGRWTGWTSRRRLAQAGFLDFWGSSLSDPECINRGIVACAGGCNRHALALTFKVQRVVCFVKEILHMLASWLLVWAVRKRKGSYQLITGFWSSDLLASRQALWTLGWLCVGALRWQQDDAVHYVVFVLLQTYICTGFWVLVFRFQWMFSMG